MADPVDTAFQVKMLNAFKDLGMGYPVILKDKSEQNQYVKELLDNASYKLRFDFKHSFGVVFEQSNISKDNSTRYNDLIILLSSKWQRLAQMVANDIIRKVEFAIDVDDYNLSFQFGPDITFIRSVERKTEQSEFSVRDQLYKAVMEDIDNLIKIQIDHPYIFRFYQQCQDLGLIRDVTMTIYENEKYDFFREEMSINASTMWKSHIHQDYIPSRSTWSADYFKRSHCHIHDIMLHSGYKAVYEIEKIVRSGQNITVKKIYADTFEISTTSKSFQKYQIVSTDIHIDVYDYLTEHLLTQFSTSSSVKQDDKKPDGNITIPLEYKPYGDESVRMLRCDTKEKIVGIYLIANYDPTTMYIDNNSGINKIYSRQGNGISLELEPVYVFDVTSAPVTKWYRAAYELGKNMDMSKKIMIVTNPSYSEHFVEAERMLESIQIDTK